MTRAIQTFLASLLLSSLLSLPLLGQDKVVNRLIEIAKEDNRTMEHLDILTNRIGGRVAGSYANEQATNWIASLLENWGLEVEVEEAGELSVGFNRGPWFGRMLSDDGFNLHFVTPSYTSGTKGVERGHVVIEPYTTAQFNRMKLTIDGAWVLIGGQSRGGAIDRSHKADVRRREIIRENDRRVKYNDSVRVVNRGKTVENRLPYKELVREPALFYREMVEAGMLGTVQSAPVPLRAMHDRYTIDSLTFDNLPTTPDIKLNEKQYRVIEEKVKDREYFLLEFEIRNHFRPGPVKYYNVFGIIRGEEHPEQYVMSGGHIDSYDVATGAVDCGTGVAPNLEAARLLSMAGARPKRSIRFCFWAAEEFGLRGSKKWVHSNLHLLDSISNYFNRDGGPTVANSIEVPPAMYEDFKKATAVLNSIDPRFPFTLKKRTAPAPPIPTIRNAGSSDHAWFKVHGAPAITFGTGDPLGYNFTYREIWHTERDVYTKSIPEYMEHSTLVIAIVLYNLANQEKLLSREGLYAKPKKGDKR